ncbi:MAG: trypsin-like serine protease [Pseudolabrys sp.]|nr:trypsin-like serine protease [Pseudolabrys sp.]
MPGHRAPVLTLIMSIALLAAAEPAGAVVKGTSSSLGAYAVRLVGPYHCTGVAIGRRLVVTAAHCANRAMRVGGSIAIAGESRSAVLDDGRRVSVTGDAAILTLASPHGYSLAPIGNGTGDSFTIAGYGTTDERHRAAFGALHEARLVAAAPRALVDPNRSGSIGASACFGDSGGPVMRGGMLVGIITRAAHPSPRIACGHLTRWAPVTVSGDAAPIIVAARDDGVRVAEPRMRQRQPHRPRARATEPPGLFASWFAPAPDIRRVKRRKHAAR